MSYLQKIFILTLSILVTAMFHLPLAADIYLEGKVISTETGLPLDSVRVASTRYTTVTTTGPDGQFILRQGKNRTCPSETLTVDSFDEYSIEVTSTSRRLTLRGKGNKPVPVALFDISGRTVQKYLFTSSFAPFPDRTLSGGIYILNVPNRKPARILVADNHNQGFLEKKHHVVNRIIQPACRTDDTIFFCKENHVSSALSAADVRRTGSVRLFEKRRVACDLHNHTVLTDGAYVQDSLLAHAFNEGNLDVYVNSEHGGAFYLDSSGIDLGLAIPRWYSLIFYSWPKLMGQRRRYPDKTILQGLEWNCPGHEHASVGFIDDNVQPGAIARFEYQFDFSEYDTSISWIYKSNSYLHANAIKALEWLQQNYPSSSYCFANHPSREATGPFNVEHFRDFHNAAPDVFLGLEGMPGHHKLSTRGSYGRGIEPRHRTWGGADYIIARVGGLWDALLGEGRHLWIIVDSDFHATTADFWPGEYAKTNVMVTDTGARAWLDGLKSGDMFIAHGDLITDLEFTIDDGINRAAMGSDLHTDAPKLAVMIKFRSPETNNSGEPVKVNHIDLIAGPISGRVNPQDSLAYRSPVNAATAILRRFYPDTWSSENGWEIIRDTISCAHPTFLRLRGTNLAVGTTGEVDEDGNPLMDEDGMNNATVAWHDLWFYSNPIFVFQR